MLALIKVESKEEIERQATREEAEEKNRNLVCLLKRKRETFATIGTNKAKRRLNKLSKTDIIAKAVRIAIEIEDKNILAKDSHGKYQDKIYNSKSELILKLILLFKEQNWNYGIQKSNNYSVSHVIYFEIPYTEQISWHFSPESAKMPFTENNKTTWKKVEIPVYNREWDKKVNSTLDKLEVITLKLLKENNLL